jgi:hypothetical protein
MLACVGGDPRESEPRRSLVLAERPLGGTWTYRTRGSRRVAVGRPPTLIWITLGHLKSYARVWSSKRPLIEAPSVNELPLVPVIRQAS